MKRTVLAAAVVLSLVVPGLAKAVDSYQVTGTVTEYEKGKSITVNKDGEKFEIGLDKKSKIEGDVKKDGKVTVKYKMTATSVESKDEKKDDGKKEKKDKKK